MRCLISAGPTREPIDAFRFLSNPSSGKMGYALAEAALARGWSVDLVSGPVALPEPEGAIVYPVETGEEMLHQVEALFDPCDLLIMAAAVCDFRPAHPVEGKMKRQDHPPSIALEAVPDILEAMTQHKRGQFMVGFAAETENVLAYARQKRREKDLDLIVANSIAPGRSAFGSDDNEVTLIDRGENILSLGPASKQALAREIIANIAARLAPPHRE